VNKHTALLLLLVFTLSACAAPAAPPTEPPITATATFPASTYTPTQTSLPTPTSTPEVTASPMCVDETCLTDGLQLEFLIVTRPMFVEALQPFIDWKSQNGFRVGLVTVEWLDAGFEGRDMAERMKTGMHFLRRRTGFQYALLVGDTVVYPSNDYETPVANFLASYTLAIAYNVPTGFYRRLNEDPATNVLPSDAYFVEDRDWDPEDTGVNPRPDNMETGDGTLHANLYLGRWPARTLTDLGVVIQKTITMTPADSLFVAGDESTYGTTWCSFWPPTVGYHMACYQNVPLLWQEPISADPGPYVTTERMMVDLNDPAQASALMDRILSNEDVMALGLHGNLECLGVVPNDCLSAARFQFQNNFPLLDIQACVVGNYSHPTRSFAESLLFAPKGPAILSAAPVPMLFLREVRDGSTVGKAYWGTASAWIYWPNPLFLLGDPSLPVMVPPAE
jgi:hypothetical protein